MESIEDRYVRRLKEKLRQKLTKNAKKPLMGRLTDTLRDHLTLDEEGGRSTDLNIGSAIYEDIPQKKRRRLCQQAIETLLKDEKVKELLAKRVSEELQFLVEK